MCSQAAVSGGRNLRKLKKVKGPEQYSPDWHALRVFDPDREEDKPKVVIGASEAAAACGMSRWGNPLTLFRKKRGYVESDFSSEAAEIGLALEPSILDLAEKRLPEAFPELSDVVKDGRVKIRRNINLCWLKDFPFVAASPDGTMAYGAGLVDAKASFSPFMRSEWGESGTEEIPDQYYLQAQQQMLVFGMKAVYFPVLLGYAGMRVYRVDGNPEIQQSILDNEQELYERIVNDDPPEPDWEDPNVLKQVKELHGFNADRGVVLDDEATELYTRYQKAVDVEKLAKKTKDKMLAILLHSLGDATYGEIPGTEVALCRTLVESSVVTEKDVEALKAKLGQPKRKSYVRTTFKKIRN